MATTDTSINPTRTSNGARSHQLSNQRIRPKTPQMFRLALALMQNPGKARALFLTLPDPIRVRFVTSMW
jgi:hypothetical protein